MTVSKWITTATLMVASIGSADSQPNKTATSGLAELQNVGSVYFHRTGESIVLSRSDSESYFISEVSDSPCLNRYLRAMALQSKSKEFRKLKDELAKLNGRLTIGLEDVDSGLYRRAADGLPWEQIRSYQLSLRALGSKEEVLKRDNYKIKTPAATECQPEPDMLVNYMKKAIAEEKVAIVARSKVQTSLTALNSQLGNLPAKVQTAEAPPGLPRETLFPSSGE